MSEELERLRADLEVLEQYAGDHIDIREAEKVVRIKIARLEAKAADPWQEAKTLFDVWERAYGDPLSAPKIASNYVNHLTAERDRLVNDLAIVSMSEIDTKAENARLAARVAELEGANTAWKEAASVWTVESEMVDTPERLSERIADLCGVKPLADMQPPFEGPVVGLDPILDPARVLLTAIGILVGEKEFKASASISDVMFRSGFSAAKPYRLKGASE